MFAKSQTPRYATFPLLDAPHRRGKGSFGCCGSLGGMPRSRFLDGAVLFGIDNFPDNLRDRPQAGPILRRLAWLAPASLQQGFRGGDARSRRRIFLSHDFGQHQDGGPAMPARQFAYVIWKICFIRRHENKVTGWTGQINPCAPVEGKLQVVLIRIPEVHDCRRTQARRRYVGL